MRIDIRTHVIGPATDEQKKFIEDSVNLCIANNFDRDSNRGYVSVVHIDSDNEILKDLHIESCVKTVVEGDGKKGSPNLVVNYSFFVSKLRK